MHIPEDYWRVKVQEVSESVRSIVERYLINIASMLEKNAGLVICGGIGVGKTSIAVLLMKEARAIGKTAYFTSVWELRESVRSRIPFDDESSVLDRCREVDLLVLDDLREEDLKDKFFGARDLEALIGNRGGNKRVTVITTPIGVRGLELIAPMMMSILMGYAVVFEVEGPNLREKKNKELMDSVLGSCGQGR
jgi:DNA replication protein DnaC